MSADPITTAASTAAIGAATAAITGAPPDIVVIAALAGSICNAWMRPGSTPEWTPMYIIGTLIHTILSFGVGLSGALLMPAFVPAVAAVPAWALAFPLSACTHQIIPSVTELRGALIERIRGHSSVPTPDTTSTTATTTSPAGGAK